MNRVCTHCRSVADAENVYCPVCGKRLEENTEKKKKNDFLSSLLGAVKTFTAAFFEPMSFYRKAADEKKKPRANKAPTKTDTQFF